MGLLFVVQMFRFKCENNSAFKNILNNNFTIINKTYIKVYAKFIYQGIWYLLYWL